MKKEKNTNVENVSNVEEIKEENATDENVTDENISNDKEIKDETSEIIKKLEEEKNNLEEKNKDLENRILREKAELINYRKRKDDEVATIKKYASENIIKDILPVVDNFERAIKLDDDNLEDELSKFLEGFKIIYCNLSKILEENGVKKIDESKIPFDPSIHNAVLVEESDLEEGTVIEVLQPGYMLKDRVLRPAMVKVSK
jgi:molecular chaperone GrpE